MTTKLTHISAMKHETVHQPRNIGNLFLRRAHYQLQISGRIFYDIRIDDMSSYLDPMIHSSWLLFPIVVKWANERIRNVSIVVQPLTLHTYNVPSIQKSKSRVTISKYVQLRPSDRILLA